MAVRATFSIEFGDLAAIRLHERLPLEHLRPGKPSACSARCRDQCARIARARGSFYPGIGPAANHRQNATHHDDAETGSIDAWTITWTPSAIGYAQRGSRPLTYGDACLAASLTVWHTRVHRKNFYPPRIPPRHASFSIR